MEAASGAVRAYRDTPFPDAGTPWREAAYAVVDLELTGLDPSRDEIISFAAVPVLEGKVIAGGTQYQLVKPSRMPNADTILIHGLRESDLAEAPPLADVLEGLLSVLAGRALVAHVAGIETGFLGAALERRGLTLENPVIDTAQLAIELGRLQRDPPPMEGTHPARGAAGPAPNLGDLARWLGLPVHRPHHAEGDALTTAQAFIALAHHLEAFSPQTLGSLVRASRPPRERISLGSVLGRFGIERFRR
jgi:DNA polymerase III subunit epsilon